MTGVRANLAGLTTRGRSLLACGAALVVWALFLGQNDLLRVAVFLLVLPLVAVAVAVRTQYRLSCTRFLDPQRVAAGFPATVRLRLHNISRLPSGVLLLDDALPDPLGDRPRFVLDRIEPGGGRWVAYPVRTERRGRFRVGPLSVRLTDPFGLCELTRSFASTSDLVVHPQVVPLPPIRLGGEHSGGGDASSLALSSSGTDDATTREYRRGDDLRKVHWRSTARVGELMVRREEQPFQSRATLLLDGRIGAHRGDGPASSYEGAVSAVASVGVSLARAGFALQLVDETGSALAHFGALTETVLLDTLAAAAPSGSPLLGDGSPLRRGGTDGVLIAVLGALDTAETGRVGRLRQSTGTCVAILIDTASFTAGGSRAGSTAYDASAAHLSAAGWRVLQLARGDDLAERWPLVAGRGLLAGAVQAG